MARPSGRGRVLASHVNAEHNLTVWNRSSAAVRAATPVVSLWADPERLRVYNSAAKAAADKLVNNLTVAIATQGIVEALRLGHSGGLTSEEVFAVIAAPELI